MAQANKDTVLGRLHVWPFTVKSYHLLAFTASALALASLVKTKI